MSLTYIVEPLTIEAAKMLEYLPTQGKSLIESGRQEAYYTSEGLTECCYP